MKKIKMSKKLSLNKENVSILNNMEQMNAKGGALPKTKGTDCLIVCATIFDCGTGCVCTGSLVKTCGIYCPPDDVIK